ncbi:metallophosphoesterase [Acidocella sp. KAb 2-4]|uniref:metallophosphoesterase n=1 Tax=Acidocella sp. KAb 2-4 TaxID=2885158 RepID=UPI001D067B5B|nr:metallophosphoesterase [Acidocella sp. KAb 2-4]
MIRILYMSDLHLEMERWQLSVPGWRDFMARHRAPGKHPLRGPLLTGLPEADLVVMAGDIHTGLRAVVYAEQVADYLGLPVVLVAGNHEFYHQQIQLVQPALFSAAERSGGKVRYLENSVASFELPGGRLHVLGCTLWTDFTLHGDPGAAMEFASAHMNDFRLIYRMTTRFTPENARARHERSRAWLHITLARLRAEDPAARIVVVTHHAPGAAFLGRRKGGIAPAYASELLPEFQQAAPDAWIHGHTHFRHESQFGAVRVVSAPRGYVSHEGARALDFRPGLLEL